MPPASKKNNEMSDIEFTPSGKLKITASKNSSKSDFDFLIGTHYVRHKKLKARLNNSQDWEEFDGTQEMQVVLDGLGDVDRYFMTTSEGKPIEGLALRFFNPKTKLWCIYWADSRSGTLDPVPVVGSFRNNVGYFFALDKLNGNEIIIQFKWDLTNPNRPVWGQAFSSDRGKSWEWNWYMYFSKEPFKSNESDNHRQIRKNNSLAANQPIRTLELRNYVTKTGQRDEFIAYFEENFIDSQNALGGFVLGQFKVKGSDDNFFWIRGYRDMAERSKYLPAFYQGNYWKDRRDAANRMLVNNDNVYLLKPLPLPGKDIVVNSNEFGKGEGLVSIEYYLANTRLDELINFFKEKYISFLENNGIRSTFWISELQQNDFPALPVFQDKNLLVTISFYKDENEYNFSQGMINSKANKQLQGELREIVTTKNTVVIYPTRNSFGQ